MADLHELLEQVSDQETFFAFVRALAEDFSRSASGEREQPGSSRGAAAGGWENVTVDTFLEAALAWAEATGMGRRQGLSDAPSWKAFATFLYTGRIYE